MIDVPMEDPDTETTALVTSATLLPSSSSVAATAEVNLKECRETKQKYYKQHFLALFERCKHLQQVNLCN